MLKSSTIYSELSVVMFGFGIYELIYGKWAFASNSSISEFGARRAFFVLGVIISIIMSIQMSTLFFRDDLEIRTSPRFGRTRSIRDGVQMYLMFACMTIICGWALHGFKQAFVFFVAYAMAILSIYCEYSNKIDELREQRHKEQRERRGL